MSSHTCPPRQRVVPPFFLSMPGLEDLCKVTHLVLLLVLLSSRHPNSLFKSNSRLNQPFISDRREKMRGSFRMRNVAVIATSILRWIALCTLLSRPTGDRLSGPSRTHYDWTVATGLYSVYRFVSRMYLGFNETSRGGYNGDALLRTKKCLKSLSRIFWTDLGAPPAELQTILHRVLGTMIYSIQG